MRDRQVDELRPRACTIQSCRFFLRLILGLQRGHKDQDSDLIEDADTDTEDDCNFGANNKSNTDKNLAAVSTSSTQAWYHAFISLDLKTKVLTTQNQNAHFCGYSSPTFFRLQVLRI